MLTVPGLAVRNLRHRRVRTMFLAALVLILSAALFTSRVLTESMKTCIDKTVDRIGADVIVAPGEYGHIMQRFWPEYPQWPLRTAHRS